MNENIINCFIQLYISVWADYEKDGLDESYIQFLKDSAAATRSYLKAIGKWVEEENE